MNTTTKDYSEQTRQIYHKQHMRIANDDVAMQRFISMFSTEYFGLERHYFEGKKVLDAGCGDTGKVIIALANMGASDLHGVDLGDDFIPVATKSIQNQGIDIDKVTLKSGSVLQLPYADHSFDFVVCHGVLVHLNSLDEVKTAFSELARVCRPGGMLYSVYGIVGGLLEEAVIPAVREYYRNNAEFKAFIDNVDPDNFEGAAQHVSETMMKQTGEDPKLDALIKLLDVDFCVMLQNLIQAPVRLAVPETMIRNLYSEQGFEDVKRLRRYVMRKNIRKYLAPFHYAHDHPMSKLFWGSGNLEFIARKK